MRWEASVLTVGLLLAGCASKPTMVWRHDSADAAQFRRDGYECQRDTRMAFGPATARSGMWAVIESGQQEDFFRRCMATKGYERVPEQNGRADVPAR